MPPRIKYIFLKEMWFRREVISLTRIPHTSRVLTLGEFLHSMLRDYNRALVLKYTMNSASKASMSTLSHIIKKYIYANNVDITTCHYKKNISLHQKSGGKCVRFVRKSVWKCVIMYIRKIEKGLRLGGAIISGTMTNCSLFQCIWHSF